MEERLKVNKVIKAGKKKIGQGEPVFIIAEAGVNHNGDIKLAKKMVRVAKDCGADAIKFQTFKAENLNTKTAPKSRYHIETTGSRQSWFDLLKSQELDKRAHEILIKYSKELGIMFLSTPYDEESADLLDELDVPIFKVASTDANNTPFLKYISRKKRPIILSTGMCTLEEVKRSVDCIRSQEIEDLILMHCTSNYPAKIEDSNLLVLKALRERFDVLVGYSDHTPGYINPIAAVAAGAVVFEKHFTLDKKLPGPDHRSSLDPDELRRLVIDIRNTELALGSGIKRPVDSEKENRINLRKSLVSKVRIPAGTILSRDMLVIKRPGTGISPADIDLVIGKKVKKQIEEDRVIKPGFLK